jgi:hypothetical protein
MNSCTFRSVFGLLAVASCHHASAFDTSTMMSYRYGDQRLIEAKIVGVDERGVVVRGEVAGLDTGVIIVPLSVAAKDPQILMRARQDIEKVMADNAGQVGLVDENELQRSRHDNGEILYRSSSRSSSGSIIIDNPTASDAVVKLVSPKRKYTFLTVFVKAGHTATIGDVFPTTYKAIYALGFGWGRDSEESRISFVGEFQEWIDLPDTDRQRAYLQLRPTADNDDLDYVSNSSALHTVAALAVEKFDAY